MKKYLIILLLIAFAISYFSAYAQESNEKLYRIYVTDPTEIKILAEQDYDIYTVKEGNYVEVLAHPDKIKALKSKNISVDFIANSFKELLEQQLGTTLSEYHDYAATYQELTQVAANFPAITKLDTIGYSVEGRVIGVLKVSDNPEIDEDEPPILIVGCHHGNEILSVEATLFFIQYLVNNYGGDPEVTNWVDTMEIWFLPLLNPDGRERITRRNANNVDLNRNYSFQHTPGGSHGPYGFSEPETQAIRDFAAIHPPILSLTYHTSGQLVLYCWTHTDAIAPDQAILMQIGGTVADSTNYELRQGGHWYFTAGEYCDFMYGVYGAMAFTVEMYTSQAPSPTVIDQVMARNLPGFIALLKLANRSGITGIVANNDTAVTATIDIAGINDQGLLFPRQSDPNYGRYYRYLAPGQYTVNVSAPGFQTRTFTNIPVSFDSLTILDVNLAPSAYILVKNYQIDDDSLGSSSGNDDGFFNINETVCLSLTVENQHPIKSKNVYAKLHSSNSYVDMLKDSLFFGDLEILTPVTAADSFLFYIEPACPDSEILDFDLTIYDSSGMEWHNQWSFEVYAPNLKINNIVVDDTEGNQNGVLDNGEIVEISVKIKNTGRQGVNQLTGKLLSDDPYIQIKQNTDQISFIGMGQDSVLNFQVKLSSTAPKLHLTYFQVKLTSAEQYVSEQQFRLHNIQGLFDDFEYENLDWKHDSWKVTTNHHNDWQWGTPQGKAGDPSSAFSGTKCWGTDLGYDDYNGTSWNGYYQHDVYNYLKSPTFDCSGLQNVELKFQRWLNVLPGDAARIKINSNIVWTSPTEGILDKQWTEQLVDIAALADDNAAVTVMFELQSNSDGWAGGWNIDDILVTGDLISNISENITDQLPWEFELLDNYPNPFNPTTRIAYTIPARQHVVLKIIDVMGRDVITLVHGEQDAGYHQVIWNGKNKSGDTVSSSVYFYQLETDNFVRTKKLLFLK